MNLPFRRIALYSVLSAMLCSALLLTACTSEPPAGETATESTAETAASEMNCTVSVQNYDGTPLTDVVVKVQKDGQDVTRKVIGPTGAAVSFTLPADTYTLHLESPSGVPFYFDTEEATLTPDKTDLTIKVYKGAAGTWKLYAPSQKVLDGYVEMQAPLLEEGATYVEMIGDDYTYLVFNPTRGGVYAFAASEDVTISYHGIPLMVSEEPRIDTDENGIVTIEVEDSSVGDDSVSQLVLRLSPKEGLTPDHAIVTVTRTGDLIKSPEELAQWVEVTADRAALDALATLKEPAEDDKWYALTAGELTNLNVEDDSLTVVLGSDGYYHLGTADGPLVFLRVTSDSPYIPNFVKMCETDRLRAYMYDENGTFLRKEYYNSLFNAYGEVANADGVVPLNVELATAVRNAGDFMGWWNYDRGSQIFDSTINPDVAWLFACAIYQ